MSGYVVSKGGTFGVVRRQYRNGDGVSIIVIDWGQIGWLTPVYEADCKKLRSSYEGEARQEAIEWLAAGCP